MLNKYRRTLLLCLALLGFAPHVPAQDNQYDVFKLGFLYDDIKFDEVVTQAREMLAQPARYNREQLSAIHAYMALAFYNLGQQDSSRAHFYTVLTLTPDYAPDPVKVSPKIIRFFERIRDIFLQDQQKLAAVSYTRYVFVEDIRPRAGLQSFMLPGWGQYIKGQHDKAWWIGGVFSAGALSAGIAYLLEKNYREAYQQEIRPDLIQSRYDAYNSASKVRRVFIYSTLLVWAYAIGDAFWAPYQPSVYINQENMTLGLSWSF